MMNRSHCLALLATIAVCSAAVAAETDSSTSVTRVVFGSCIKQDQPTPIFKAMAEEKPDLLIFTGDNIYADTDDMTVMRTKYNTLAENESFGRLRQSATVLATWDDHDYGVNDGGADFPKRDQSQKEFLDFWGVAPDSPRRSRSGVYDARVFGPAGKRVQVILLDTRYFRSPLKIGERRVGGPYYPDSTAGKTMLGEDQWHWLERQLQEPAEIRLIISSIQFVPSDSGQECWANLPRERQRMLNLINTTKANGVVFISGDRHWSEVSRTNNSAGYPIYDITCSSLNQLHSRGTPTANDFRVGTQTYHRENYGLLTIDWNGSNPVLAFSIRDLLGKPVIQQTISLGDLTL
ncbi:MAG: alkaline phosphatase family protein [Planctomycetales bacterium]|nr:alkaline phosphatase family protein [Planctomycetales bacterium]